jgi:hypothetical protein
VEIAFYALLGWCGNEPRRWPFFHPVPDPGPLGPSPEPWIWLVAGIGIVAGIVGGLVFGRALTGTTLITAGSFDALAVGGAGAFVLSRFATDVMSIMRRR